MRKMRSLRRSVHLALASKWLLRLSASVLTTVGVVTSLTMPPGGAAAAKSRVPSAFATARPFWAEAASLPDAEVGAVLQHVGKVLAKGEDPANRSSYSQAINQLKTVPYLYAAGSSQAELSSAHQAVIKLGAFFGTPGLYIKTRFWPAASPLPMPRCGSTQVLFLASRHMSSAFVVMIEVQKAKVLCGGMDYVNYLRSGPKLIVPLAVDAPVFELRQLAAGPITTHRVGQMDIGNSGFDPYYTYTQHGDEVTALTQVYES